MSETLVQTVKLCRYYRRGQYEVKALDQGFYRLLARQPDPENYLPALSEFAAGIPQQASPESLRAIIRRLESEH